MRLTVNKFLSPDGVMQAPGGRKLARRGTAIMKLTTITMVTVDGVMQGLGGPDEDRRGGFERGGWVAPLFDDEAGTFLNQVYQRADAFLFGRRTYEIFASSWGAWADPGGNPIWTALNSRPKYVASTTLTDPKWADTTVLSGDVAAAVGELKAKPGVSCRYTAAATWSAGYSPTSLSTRSSCWSAPWSSARARGCSPAPVRTQRLTWWNRGPPRRG
jgi:dihydrofolate reductase